jgi:hypothetical protein
VEVLAVKFFKALTVCQPHASAIIRGPKRFENRTWSTSHVGPLVIHAGASRKWFNPITREFYEARGFQYGFGDRSLPLGAFIGLVWLDCCIPIHAVGPEAFRECAEGPACWHVIDPLAFPEPIPAKGALGMMNAPAELFLPIPGVREWLEKQGTYILDSSNAQKPGNLTQINRSNPWTPKN